MQPIMDNTTAATLGLLDASTTTLPQNEANFTWLTLIPITAFLIIIICVPMLPAESREALREAANSSEDNNNKTTNPLKEMSLEQRKEVYKQAFVSNRNYITLTNSNLIESSSSSENNSKDEIIKMNNSPSNNSCEYVDIELGDDDDDDDDDDDEIASSKSMHLVFEKKHYNAEGESACNKQKQQQQQHEIVTTNDTSCIICLDDFNVNDTIVWSENYECPHFYHRECMIDYFASKRQKKKIITDTNLRENQSNDQSDDNADDISRTERTIDDEHNTIIEDNPCPTCRRNFCSITMKDLNIVKS
jgi:hypothetical protein